VSGGNRKEVLDKMKTLLTFMVVNTAFAATLLFAQTPTPTPAPMRTPPSPATMAQRQVQRLTAWLGLSSAQQADALPIFTTLYTTAQSVATNVRTARMTLHTAILANDINTINSTSTTIGNLTAQLTQAESTAQAAFYQILNPSQQTTYTSTRPRGMGGFGPGGMGPGPMGGGPGGMGPGGGPGRFGGGR